MKIRALGAYFIRREVRTEKWIRHLDGEERREVEGPVEYYVPVETIPEADGLAFMCPKCFVTHGGSVGTHWVVCWRPHVPPEVEPKPGRWEFLGTSLDDLTLKAGSSSILLGGEGGCQAHFFIEGGGVRMA